MSTTTPTSAVQVHTAQGTRTLVPTITSTKFDKTVVPPCIRAFLDVAHAIVGALPKSSASSIDASLRSFRAFVEWSGEKFETTVPSPEWLIAYIVARSTPAVGTPLPDDKAFHRPVLPTTAVGDVDDLRRGARIGVASLARWSEALNHESVFAFSKEVGGRISKLRTNKRPFLFIWLTVESNKTVDSMISTPGHLGGDKGNTEESAVARSNYRHVSVFP